MVSGLSSAASAMDAQTERLAVLANNLANVTAAGYKADHLEFFQLLTSPRAAGSVSPADSAAPLQALPRLVETRTDLRPGAIRQTGNPLDLAIDGPGFFVVQTEGGRRLTRTGTFTRSGSGLLTTLDGIPVVDVNGRPVSLPEGGSLEIDERGAIRVDGAQITTLLVVNPRDPSRLRKEAGTRFAPPEDLELIPSAGDARIRQGAIELSNVNPILTLVEMIDALRVYEAAQRTARGVDDTLRRAVNEVGRPV